MPTRRVNLWLDLAFAAQATKEGTPVEKILAARITLDHSHCLVLAGREHEFPQLCTLEENSNNK